MTSLIQHCCLLSSVKMTLALSQSMLTIYPFPMINNGWVAFPSAPYLMILLSFFLSPSRILFDVLVLDWHDISNATLHLLFSSICAWGAPVTVLDVSMVWLVCWGCISLWFFRCIWWPIWWTVMSPLPCSLLCFFSFSSYIWLLPLRSFCLLPIVDIDVFCVSPPMVSLLEYHPGPNSPISQVEYASITSADKDESDMPPRDTPAEGVSSTATCQGRTNRKLSYKTMKIEDIMITTEIHTGWCFLILDIAFPLRFVAKQKQFFETNKEEQGYIHPEQRATNQMTPQLTDSRNSWCCV